MGSSHTIFLLLLAVGTITTGCLNSIFTKYQDNQCVKFCDNPDVSTHQTFQQPAIQTFQMFLGELCCFFVWYLMYKTTLLNFQKDGYQTIDGEGAEPFELKFRDSLKLAVPAICDLLGTTLLHFGLIYIPVSVYQMMRGSLVLFVAFMSVVVLKKKITKLEWLSLIIITLGITLVGLSGSKSTSEEEHADAAGASMAVIGIFLVIIAEFCQAFQFVVEEHILAKQPIVPLQLVYYEGAYGASIILILMLVLNFFIGTTSNPGEFENSPFNLKVGFGQVFHSSHILLASILIMISISSFNYFGVSVTLHLSATARSTIDACRTLLVWILAMIMGWESFIFLQFVGFGLLVFGTLCFNGVLTPEEWNWVPKALKTPKDQQTVFEEPVERL